MNDIIIKTIPHNQHRYETVGDYWRDMEGNLQIRVSEMGNPDYEILVAIHELIEVILTEKRGVMESHIMNFDVHFEKERKEGLHDPDEEPGDSPHAPYRREHFMAEALERILSDQLGVSWSDYGKAVMLL